MSEPEKDVLLTASMAKEVADIYSSHSIEHGCGDGEWEPEMVALRSLASGRTVTVPVDVLGVLRDGHELLRNYLTINDWPVGEPMAYFAKLNAAIARIDAILETPDSTRGAKP